MPQVRLSSPHYFGAHIADNPGITVAAKCAVNIKKYFQLSKFRFEI